MPINLFLVPSSRPSDSVSSYPVVSLAVKTPVSNRRVRGNRLAVKDQHPVSGAERSNDLFADFRIKWIRWKLDSSRFMAKWNGMRASKARNHGSAVRFSGAWSEAENYFGLGLLSVPDRKSTRLNFSHRC